jgi:inosine-uridine nucleoside N-ribohydrolase
MQHQKQVWLDCDPGHDDMLAIILSALSEEINLLGISTSAGNSTIDNTTQNALNILHEINRTDVDVYKGLAHPLIQ